MTDPDIAVCLEILECTNADDLDGVIARCHEDVVCEPFLAQVEGAPYVGHDGMRRWWEERREAWERITVETGEIERLGRHLLMRHGMVAWWGVYSTEQDALDRLRERDPSL